MDFEEVNRYIKGMITAIDVRYDLGQGPDLLGRRMRNARLKRGRLHELRHAGRGLPLDPAGALSVEGGADRIDHVVDTPQDVDVPAVLLRPDGHVAWAGVGRRDLLDRRTRWSGTATG
jgi:hypothetical protein